jgi:predicted  nucleic acid-binding Zn-ribbon protein
MAEHTTTKEDKALNRAGDFGDTLTDLIDIIERLDGEVTRLQGDVAQRQSDYEDCRGECNRAEEEAIRLRTTLEEIADFDSSTGEDARDMRSLAQIAIAVQ